MATNNSLKNTLIEKDHGNANIATNMIKNLLNSEDIKRRFTEVLKDKALLKTYKNL